MKELYKQLKKDPVEVIGAFVLPTLLFALFYAAMWIFY